MGRLYSRSLQNDPAEQAAGVRLTKHSEVVLSLFFGEADHYYRCKEEKMLQVRKKTGSKLTAILLALMMAVVFMPQFGAVQKASADEAVKEVKVDVLVQKGENTDVKAFKDLAVSSDTAESYGFTEPEKVRDPDESAQIPLAGQVTTLDALVEVTHQLYGEAFTRETASDYLVVSSTGTIKKIFGEETIMSGFTVNGENPMYEGESSYGATGSLIDDSIIEEGDSLRFFRTFDDDFGMGGLYSSMFYFDDEDQMDYEAIEGDDLTIPVSVDYAFANMIESMGGGPELEAAETEVSLIDINGTERTRTEEVDPTTNNVFFQGLKAGEYYAVVTGYDGNDFDDHFVTAYATINVVKKESIVPAEPTTAEVSAAVRNFEKENQFDIVPQTITVSSDTAEKYGDFRDIVYGKNDGKVTLADLLYKMHEMKYGEAFTKNTATDYIEAGITGYLSRCFAAKTKKISYLINEDLTMSGGIYQIVLQDGDRVDLYKYLDEMNYADLYTHFTEEAKTVLPGKSFKLQLEGLGWSYPLAPLQKATDGDVIAATYDDNGVLTDIEGAVMDENGQITLSFNELGTYKVAAKGVVNAPVADYSNWPDISYTDATVPIVLPYTTITVAKGDQKITKVTPLSKNFKAKKKTKKLAKNYTFKLKATSTGDSKQAVVFSKANKVGGKKIVIAKNGKVTVKKGLKKGTYKVKVKVTKAGNNAYNAAPVFMKTIKIKVK